MNNFKGETIVRVGMPAIIHELLKDKSNKHLSHLNSQSKKQ